MLTILSLLCMTQAMQRLECQETACLLMECVAMKQVTLMQLISYCNYISVLCIIERSATVL